jgi:hypothetical protein
VPTKDIITGMGNTITNLTNIMEVTDFTAIFLFITAAGWYTSVTSFIAGITNFHMGRTESTTDFMDLTEEGTENITGFTAESTRIMRFISNIENVLPIMGIWEYGDALLRSHII